MAKKLTIGEVESRVKAIGREITILEWNGTENEGKYVCNNCGNEYKVRRGCYTYKEDNKYFKWGRCIGCEMKTNRERRIVVQHQISQAMIRDSRAIDLNIHKIISLIEKYLGQEVESKKLVEQVCEYLDINTLSIKRFNFSILDRVCDYDVVKLNKYGKLGYVIKNIHTEALDKTEERIEIEDKANSYLNRY